LIFKAIANADCALCALSSS